MRDILANIRYMLAYVDLEKMNIGIIAQQFIQNDVLPDLRRQLEMARTDEDEERLTDLIEEYVKYGDPKSQEGKIYTKTASNIIRQLAQRSRMGDDEMEDLMQELAMDFLKPLVAGGKDMMDNLRQKFHPEGGPASLNKLWASMVDWRVTWRIRETQRLYKEKTIERKQTDEGEELDPIQQIPGDATPFDEEAAKNIPKQLSQYIRSKLHNPKFISMFDHWFAHAQKGFEKKIDLKKDVYKEMVDEGLTTGYSAFKEQWDDNVLPTIQRFFIDEMDMEPSMVRRYVGSVSLVEAVTQAEYHRRVAKWMLGGILRAQIEAGE